MSNKIFEKIIALAHTRLVNSGHRTRLSMREQIFFFTQLSHLLGAGVPLAESILVLQSHTTRTPVANLFKNISADISEGQPFAHSLEKYPYIFGTLIPAYIHIGEESGTLPEATALLAEELKKKQALQKKVLGALLYPCIVTIATIGIVGALTLVIFPKLIPLFLSMHVTLPLSTRIMLSVSTFLQTHWLLLGCSIPLVTYALYQACIYSPQMRTIVDIVRLRIPVIGGLFRAYYLASFFRTLGTLLQSGLPLPDALRITQKTLAHTTYMNTCRQLHMFIQGGKKLSDGMGSTSGIFSRITISSVAVAEQTGNLSNTLLYLGELYEENVDEMTKNITHALEPLLMVVMGLLVGFVALSIITPIYEITQHINIR